MKPEKQQRKLRGSVAEYLAHKRIITSLDPSITFEMLDTLRECCEPLCLESEEAREAAYARLGVLKCEKPGPASLASNPLEMQAAALLDPDQAAAVRGYARKRGRTYLRWLDHRIKHPRGKHRDDLAETWLKKAEAEIALNGYEGDRADQARRNALTMAAACLMAA